MIGQPSQRRAWTGAGAWSLALHLAVAALLVFDLPLPAGEPAPSPEPRIELIATITAGDDDGPDAPVLTSTVETVTPRETLSAISTPAELIALGSVPIIAAPASGNEGAAEPANASGPGTASPMDPRIADLIGRIRENLDDPCLLALPLTRGEDDVLLSIVAADDRLIGPLTARLTQGLDLAVTPEAVLIDPRQCPGVTFARNDPAYPAHGLGLIFENRALTSGDSLRGQIRGGAGYYNTLLLIDDNGTVHDLRRFLTMAAGEVSFDVPLARTGSSRDTHQLILAIATPDRPRSIADHAGEFARDFFPALTAELATGPALIGVGSVYIE
ncbi:MAG: hypothetical protein Q4G49_05520 [Paracoccus sp. (in: a-proteobacteria)]|nr:hypothetical protein [Paracoccus sp. (in: a-proteobacteria)]